MPRNLSASLTAALLTSTFLAAQNGNSAFVPGLDIEGQQDTWYKELQLGDTVCISVSTTACNPGTVEGTWEASPDPDHPFIGQSYFRLYRDRFEQISNWSFVKHGTFSTNTNECGGGCMPTSSDRLSINCADSYGSPANWNRALLGPPDEVDPFTATWTLFGSHFDTGYPPRVPDGVPSWINWVDDTSFRVSIPANKLHTPGATYYAMVFYSHMWEPEANRENNMSHRQIELDAVNTIHLSDRASGTVLRRWPGARIESAANIVNGTPRDGRFYVGVKVSETRDGWYHYEYAVHNRDNNGRAAQLRIPLCPDARYRRAGMKGVPLGDRMDRARVGSAPVWTVARQGNELVFDAPLDGAQPWNTVFNYWFDCDAGPADGAVELTQALPNPGANPTVTVSSDVPRRLTNVHLGRACGPTPPQLWPNGRATIPNASFALRLTNLSSASSTALLVRFNSSFVTVGNCEILRPAAILARASNPTRDIDWPLEIPNDPGLAGLDLYCQALRLRASGALLGLGDSSNVVRVRIGNSTSGCR